MVLRGQIGSPTGCQLSLSIDDHASAIGQRRNLRAYDGRHLGQMRPELELVAAEADRLPSQRRRRAARRRWAACTGRQTPVSDRCVVQAGGRGSSRDFRPCGDLGNDPLTDESEAVDHGSVIASHVAHEDVIEADLPIRFETIDHRLR